MLAVILQQDNPYFPVLQMYTTGSMLKISFSALKNLHHISSYRCLICAFSCIPILFSDVNECFHMRGGCDHQCSNTLGSYECRCNPGYTLAMDGKKCLRRYTHENYFFDCDFN